MVMTDAVKLKDLLKLRGVYKKILKSEPKWQTLKKFDFLFVES